MNGELNKNCTHTECRIYLQAIQDSVNIINGKWKAPIIVALLFGNKRFNILAKEIIGISPKMLSKELRDLEINHLVKRTVYDTTPATVEYSLTSYGTSLKSVMDALRDWGSVHRNKIFNKSKVRH